MLGKYSFSVIDRSINKRGFSSIFMPEKGWYSLTVRLSTAKAIKEISKDKKLIVDELLNELISTVQIKKLLTCSLCGVKVKSTNMSSHMAKMHPK